MRIEASRDVCAAREPMVRIELSLLNIRESIARLERIEADCKAALSAFDDELGCSEEVIHGS